jgi:pimeloyl-ACP methyl ester carboxylesterase
MATYVLVHGAWHSGECYNEVAKYLRGVGHTVYAPTLAGNRPGDSKMTGLDEAISSVIEFFGANSISDAVLVGHSYGGMVITGAADRLPEGAVRRLVYWSAFVPNDGESLEDIVAPRGKEAHLAMRQADGGLLMDFNFWREFLMNDVDLDTAKLFYGRLNNHPHQTMQDQLQLSKNPAEMTIGKSYLHCQADLAFPATHGGWHPRFSEKLGLYRFVTMPGGHEVCYTNPVLLAQKILEAGRD